MPKGRLSVFHDMNFDLTTGELVAVMGVSGVGKTTLLNLLGALDKPTKGNIYLDGDNLLSLQAEEMARVRNSKIGFVFQFYHLLPEFSVVENVSFPLLIRGVKHKEAESKAYDLLQEVSIEDKALLFPRQLSGGEQQRVAVARALINDPKVLLADEPTGNLDWKTGGKVLNLIKKLHMKKNLSSIIVTHNEKVAEFCDKIYCMEKGKLKLLSRL